MRAKVRQPLSPHYPDSTEGSMSKSSDRTPNRPAPNYSKKDKRRFFKELRQVSILSMADPVDQHMLRHVNRQNHVLERLNTKEDNDSCGSSVASDPTATFEEGLNRTAFQFVLAQLENQNKEISESTRKEIKRAQSTESLSWEQPSRWKSSTEFDTGPLRPCLRRQSFVIGAEAVNSIPASPSLLQSGVKNDATISQIKAVDKWDKHETRERDESRL